MNHKLSNFGLLVRCFFHFLKFGKSDKPIKNPKKIVIIQLAKLGDMVCTTPMFRALKNKYPECKLIVVGDRVNEELLRGNKDVDEYVLWQNDISEIAIRLRQEKLDFGCVTGPSFQGLAALYLSHIPLIAAPLIQNGYSPYETKSYKILRKLVKIVPHRMRHYAPREYLRLLEPIGIYSEDTTKHLSYSREALESVSTMLPKEGLSKNDMIVALAPSAGHKTKNWPGERYARFMLDVMARYPVTFVLTGSKKDEDEKNELLAHLGSNARVVDLVGKLSLDQLKALIDMVDMFVGVDTGPIYLSEAFDTPTLDIIGPIDENEQPPIGEIHRRIIAPTREKPQLFVMNARVHDPVLVKKAIYDITVEMVMREFEVLYETISK